MPRPLFVLRFWAFLALLAAAGCSGANDATDAATPAEVGVDARDAEAEPVDAPDLPDGSPDGASEELAPDVEPTPDVSDAEPGQDAEVDVPLPPFPAALRGECALAERLGGFVIEAYVGYSLVSGQVLDGVVPLTVLAEELREGDCRLLRRLNPLCEPPCSTSDTCGLDGACVPYPGPLGLGRVNVTGLSKPVSMLPKPPNQNYFDTSLPHPAFAVGDELRVLSEGGGLEPLVLFGYGVDALEPGQTEWVLTAGEPLDVTWDAGATDTPARVLLRLNVDQHGVSPITLVCDLPDTGQAQIPAALIDALLAAGISGFPNGKLARRTVDSVPVEGGLALRSLGEGGCVDLVVSSPRAVPTRVTGSTPCTKPADCPPGETCNLPLQICE